MLKLIEVRNFKSFREAKLHLAPLTLLIGANASGKSNAIEALELLAWMAAGQRLGDILFAMQQGQLPLRGTLANLQRVAAPRPADDRRVLTPVSQIQFKVIDDRRHQPRLTLDG